MTGELFRTEAYLRDAPARVAAHTPEGGVILDNSLFYPTGGGQPGDSGWLTWDKQELSIATQELDWDRRHKHMRVHTALHLLSVVIPHPVTGGQISASHGRLDFNMPDAPQDRAELEEALNHFVSLDARVSENWITEAELDAAPELVKTMSVAPPRGRGDIRLIRIGDAQDPIDLQPCGGTHVARTGEIGALRLGKIEKKGRLNRRVYVHLGG